eukprot:TRINITY_DN3041_c0_g1_i2.p2 TRINITY_DN3041_c0_g1~~TRINITY_DN3041_c0_g1_i2.p2  ORF type:complete len:208 (-),score=15.26 TRINITY_DN3041_c0_g1_i2:40-663(-)
MEDHPPLFSMKDSIHAMTLQFMDPQGNNSRPCGASLAFRGADNLPNVQILLWLHCARHHAVLDVPFLDVCYCILTEENVHEVASVWQPCPRGDLVTVLDSETELALWRGYLPLLAAASVAGTCSLPQSFPLASSVKKHFHRGVIAPVYPPDPFLDTVVGSRKKATHSCGVCQKPAHLKCSACKHVFYCSAACQRADWATHKLHCTKS